MTSFRSQMRYLNPYDLHKILINEYILKRPGDTTVFKRDRSKDKTDYDVIRENHKFLWGADDAADTWEARFAKKYYDKLFKEYCIADLSLYKENKIALRWRVEQEVIQGKGQFICGNKRCSDKEHLRTWEVNFCYRERGEKKNALVKIRLCEPCSAKLNYRSKKREVKRLRKKSKRPKEYHKKNPEEVEAGSSTFESETMNAEDSQSQTSVEGMEKNESPWENHKPVETKSRDEEMEDYLQDLLL